MMIVNNEKIHLFEKTKILSDIADNGYIVMIDGAQLLYEINNGDERTFTGYTNASSENIQRIFTENAKYETILKEGSITIFERNKGKKDMYIFTLVSVPFNENDPELFCQKVLGARFFSIDKVAYVPSVGIIDLEDGWKQLLCGELEVPVNFEAAIKEEPMRIIGALNKVIGNSYLSLSFDAIRCIKENKELVQYSDSDMVRYLMNTIMSRNPSKINMLKNLGVLEYLMPELDYAFTIRNNLPDFIHNNLGEGCISAIDGLDEKAAWAVIFYCAGKAAAPQENFGGFSTAIEFIEQSMVIANNFLGKTGYTQDYMLDVLSVLFLLDTDIPNDYDELLEFILKNFDTMDKLENFEQARLGIVKMYEGKYNVTETQKINNLSNLAEATIQAWVRSNINITDEEIEKTVGKENLDSAITKIKHFLVEQPMYNDRENLIALITQSPAKPAHASNKKLSPEAAAMIEERKQILQRIESFDFNKVSKVAFGREVSSDEDKSYAKEYFNCSDRLSDLNDALLKIDAFSDAEKELVAKCQNMNKIINERAEEQRFIDSIFTDTDTAFFENIYHLSKSQ